MFLSFLSSSNFLIEIIEILLQFLIVGYACSSSDFS